MALNFDDGLADQYTNALPALSSHGLDGTFYVNSGHLGVGSNYMTWSQLQAVASAGNEVAGHTVDHPNLTMLTTAEATREICNDRVNLINQGFQPTDFAYPFGAHNATIESIAHSCGYNSARVIGGIVSPFDNACMSGCPYAEAIPPNDPYAIRTPDSVTSSTTVTDLETLVNQAQAHGGGLVPIVFHDVCDNACSARSISPANFSAFLGWLQQQASGGTVAVQTMKQVIGGSFQPGVAGPPPTGTGVQNPSLETDTSGGSIPDCWQASGWGTNSPSFTRTADAHSGSWAEQLAVSSYQSGDAALLVTQDQGQCSPSVAAGRAYTIGSWYKSTTAINLYAYYRDQIGAWHWFATSPAFSAASAWTDATWITPALPSGATGISFGPGLVSNGSLTADDLTLTSSGPTVSVSAPASGQVYSGTQVLSATAGTGTDHVDFLVNGSLVGSAVSSPYSVSWNSTSVGNGPVTITARAVDASGNSTSSSVNVSIDNSGSVVKNASLEWDANSDSVPDCWQLGGYGTNTYSWTRTSDAHSGGWAERVDITSLSSGDRTVLQTMDSGTCAPSAVAGRSYSISTWYKSNISPYFLVYTRDSSGTWTFWTSSAGFAVSSTSWGQASWTTPPLPSGTTAISFGLTINTVGFLTVDDFAMSCGCDTTPPTSSATAPATATGPFSVSYTASDNTGGSGLASVDLYAEAPGQSAYSKVASNTSGAGSGSFAYTPSAGSGSYSFYTIATDKAGNVEAAPSAAEATTAYSASVTPPSSTASSPSVSTAITWTVSYTASDAGGPGLASVELWVQPPGSSSFSKAQANSGSATSGSFSYTGTAGDGSYSFYTIAVDAAGNREAAPSAPDSSTTLDAQPPTAFQMSDPGQYLRAGVTLSLASAPTDAGTGVASVSYQYRRSGNTGGWSTACTAVASPWSCAWSTNTSATPDGLYDLQAVASDHSGNTTVASNAPLTNRTIDNTAPSARSIATANVSAGTKGKAEPGDSVSFTYSEQMKPSSILAGWSGGATPVVVQIAAAKKGDLLTVWKADGSAELPLANPLKLGGSYAGSSQVKFNATMVQNGAAITITLGSILSGSVAPSPSTRGTLTWTPSAGATDLAGNPALTTRVSAAGPAF